MKIDRRSFLSLGIGLAAGTALTPLPWKLTDDISIWTQTWPWTPVPADGASHYVNSVCTLCPGGCGITVRKIDDRAVKIEGMADHPVNHGGICILGLSGLQLLYGPRRVKAPMKRVGERGEGRWEEISWEEAVAMAANRLGEVRANGNPDGVGAVIGPEYGTVPALFRRFMTAYGSPNLMYNATIADSYAVTLKMMQGTDSLAGFDLENTDFVISFGSGILEGWGSPVRMFQAHSAWLEKGVPLVQVEPRLSNTAAKAEKWIPVNPGTESVLALGMAHVMLSQGMHDKDFVENAAFGFEDWTDDAGRTFKGFKSFVLDGYAPDKVEKITGVPASLVVSLANNFAKAEHPLALCGRGKGQIPGSIHEFMAVHALNALAGNINAPGGVWSLDRPDYVDWSDPGLDDIARKGLETPRIDGAGSRRFPHTRSMIHNLPEAVARGEGALKVLMVSEANPCYTLPGTDAVSKAFEKIPFVISFSSYMDETAAAADLILPNHTYLERYQDVPAPFSLHKPIIGMTRPVVKPQCDTRHVGDALMMIARKLGGTVGEAFPWKDYEACLKETMGNVWDTLEADGFLFNPDFAPPRSAEAFATGSGRFEFFNASYRHEGESILGQMKIEGEAGDFPLILIPCDSMRLASGPIADTPFMVKTVSEKVLEDGTMYVQVNPATAREFRLGEGAFAVLATPTGTASVRVNLYDGIAPGVVAAPTGLGHTANTRYIAGKGANFNALISPIQDPVSGLNAAWGIRAKLTKA